MPNHVRKFVPSACLTIGIGSDGVVRIDYNVETLSFAKDSTLPFSVWKPSVYNEKCYFALKVWNGQQAGAAAVIVVGNVDGPVITMDSPDESTGMDGYIEKIEVPSTLIDHSFGESWKQALQKGDEILIKLDWRESNPYPDERVEYELWISREDECGIRCDDQMDFVNNFRGHAQALEKGSHTRFTPHYITWYCPEAFKLSNQCKSQCINHGRYCAPDPEQDFGVDYDGKDVVFENLRQLCVHCVANESNRFWALFLHQILPLNKIKQCMGDSESDVENPLFKAEQELQVLPLFFRPVISLGPRD
ncbi:hypothetical protein MLD38_023508 [Melastoma candidum]|uniref:Uncharacterized protein n=1 Tax=Melastoma candidum TaxID=119954 RepID=A0ACB9NVZ9_9MYRT|nr:hypothetical protein MLD38_023508 [Melastoma candidum]